MYKNPFDCGYIKDVQFQRWKSCVVYLFVYCCLWWAGVPLSMTQFMIGTVCGNWTAQMVILAEKWKYPIATTVNAILNCNHGVNFIPVKRTVWLPTNGVYDSKKYMYDKSKDLEYFVPVGINFELLPNGNLNLEYKNPDSDAAFCGVSATVEGVWIKQKN